MWESVRELVSSPFSASTLSPCIQHFSEKWGCVLGVKQALQKDRLLQTAFASWVRKVQQPEECVPWIIDREDGIKRGLSVSWLTALWGTSERHGIKNKRRTFIFKMVLFQLGLNIVVWVVRGQAGCLLGSINAFLMHSVNYTLCWNNFLNYIFWGMCMLINEP